IGWSRYHNGGGLQFAADGTLLIGTGDANTDELAPDLKSLNGKLLRIRPAASGAPAYTVPADNPWVGVAGARPEIYAAGLRNPWRIAVRLDGSDMVVGDVGEKHWEEVNRTTRGADYGWPNREGPCPNGESLPCAAAPARYTQPMAWYPHVGADQGGALTGLAWYEGDGFPPAYRGRLFHIDYDLGTMGVVKDGQLGNVTPFGANVGRVVDMEYFRNSLYLLDIVQGAIRRIDYTNTQNLAPTAVLSATTLYGKPPLAVTFSAAGSTDADDPTLRYIWNLGDGSPAPPDTADTVTHTYAAEGTYTVELLVRDTRGALSAPAQQVVTVYSGELPSITLGVVGAPERTRWYGGDQITFAAQRSTTDDLNPATPWTWRIELHHNDHIHPEIIDLPGGQGVYEIPRDNHGGDLDIHFRFLLTMHTATGQKVTVYRDLFPQTTTFGVTMAPDAPGMVNVDGVLVNTPATVPAIAGTTYQLAAEPELVVGRHVVAFSGWVEPVVVSAEAADTATRAITATLPAITYTMNYTVLRDATLTGLPAVRK
ncbi:MAG: PQQ-dependent sugar dehydrogenase, partial [Caldilineaceae bacterium]